MKIFRRSREHASIRTSCKLNLWLDVLGRRQDGYHELRSLFHELPFGDAMELRCTPAAASSVKFHSADQTLSRDPSNLCVRAAELWLARRAPGATLRIEIDLVKVLPAGGGIGGGSGDAVAVLLGLDTLHYGEPDPGTLFDLALELGSDCPFFLVGGTALVTGRGEGVQALDLPLLRNPELRVVLVMPGLHVGTRGVFAAFAAQANHVFDHPSLDVLLSARDMRSFQGALWNRLEACAVEAEPRLLEVRRALEQVWPYPPAMSGSGSTYFAFAANDADAVVLQRSAQTMLPEAKVAIVAVIGARL